MNEKINTKKHKEGTKMKKKYAIITDVHGNIDALNSILNDIKNIDKILF